MRHGYGIRKSAPYGVAAKFRSRSHTNASLTSLRSENCDETDERLEEERKNYGMFLPKKNNLKVFISSWTKPQKNEIKGTRY